MKNAVTHSLHFALLILVSCWLLYPLLYAVQVSNIKDDQRSHLEHGHHKLVKITLRRSAFLAYYDQSYKELNLAGELYDVKDITEEGDNIICTAVHDKKETRVHNNYRSSQKRDRQHNTLKRTIFAMPFFFHDRDEVAVASIPNFSVSCNNSHMVQQGLLNGYYMALIKPPCSMSA